MKVITSEDIYWLTRLDDIKGTLAFMLEACSIIAVITGILLLIDSSIDVDKDKLTKKALRDVKVLFTVSAITLIFAVPAYVFTPNSKEMAMIKIIPALANNDKVQEECADIYKLAKQGLQNLVGTEQGTKERWSNE